MAQSSIHILGLMVLPRDSLFPLQFTATLIKWECIHSTKSSSKNSRSGEEKNIPPDESIHQRSQTTACA